MGMELFLVSSEKMINIGKLVDYIENKILNIYGMKKTDSHEKGIFRIIKKQCLEKKKIECI